MRTTIFCEKRGKKAVRIILMQLKEQRVSGSFLKTNNLDSLFGSIFSTKG